MAPIRSEVGGRTSRFAPPHIPFADSVISEAHVKGITATHPNLRRGHYELATDEAVHARVRVAFERLALAV